MRAILRHPNIGYKLVGGVPQPHGFDIASDNVGGFIAPGEIVVLDSSGHGVGVGLDEDVEQAGVLDRREVTILFL